MTNTAFQEEKPSGMRKRNLRGRQTKDLIKNLRFNNFNRKSHLIV